MWVGFGATGARSWLVSALSTTMLLIACGSGDDEASGSGGKGGKDGGGTGGVAGAESGGTGGELGGTGGELGGSAGVGTAGVPSSGGNDAGTDASEDAGDAGSSDADVADVGADADPDAATGPTIGPAGGTVQLQNGAKLVIPAGALQSEVAVKLVDTGTLPPAGYTPYSNVFALEPAGTVLSIPATLTLPFTGDPNLAALFFAKDPAEGTTGFDWQGGLTIASTSSIGVTRFGEVFAADGSKYVEDADLGCVALRGLDGRAVLPAGVLTWLDARDCWQRPFPALTPGWFELTEDGSPIATLPQPTLVSGNRFQGFVTLLVDLSSPSDGHRPSIIAGAKRLVQAFAGVGFPVQFTLSVFAGEQTVTTLVGPTLDVPKVLTSVDGMLTYVAADPTGTNLNGAIVQATAKQVTDQTAFRTRNDAGAFTTGAVVVFTATRDTAAWQTHQAALDAVSQTGVTTVAAAFDGPAYDDLARTELGEIASSGLFEATDDTIIARAWSASANRVHQDFRAHYLVGYCSPKKTGTHTAGVSLAGATQQTSATYDFDATGFTSGCSNTTFDQACSGKTCGGAACGACDDQTSKCNASTDTCESYCVSLHKCGNTTVQNPLGYSQVCPDTPTSTQCGGSCVDLTSSTQNCGGCGVSCGAGICTSGACQCTGLVCQGVCINQQSDTKNCGKCGRDCLGGTCIAGECGGVDILTGIEIPWGIAVDATNLYWGDNLTFSPFVGRLSMAPKTGGAPIQLATVPNEFCKWVRVNSTHVVCFGNAGVILAVPLAGGASTGVTDAAPLAVLLTETDAFWSTATGVKRLPIGSNGPPTVVLADEAVGLDVDATYLYAMTTSNQLLRMTHSGASPTLLATVADGPIVLSGSDVVIFSNLGNATIRKVPAAGGSLTTLATSQPAALDLVADSSAVYWLGNNTGDALRRISPSGGPSVLLGQGNLKRIAMDAQFLYVTQGISGGTVRRFVR